VPPSMSKPSFLIWRLSLAPFWFWSCSRLPTGSLNNLPSEKRRDQRKRGALSPKQPGVCSTLSVSCLKMGPTGTEPGCSKQIPDDRICVTQTPHGDHAEVVFVIQFQFGCGTPAVFIPYFKADPAFGVSEVGRLILFVPIWGY